MAAIKLPNGVWKLFRRAARNGCGMQPNSHASTSVQSSSLAVISSSNSYSTLAFNSSVSTSVEADAENQMIREFHNTHITYKLENFGNNCTLVPNSTTALSGNLKNSTTPLALRLIVANKCSRHSAIPLPGVDTIVSRLKK